MSRIQTLKTVFLSALKLGVTSFGGPTAHLGYFREEYVNKRKWLDDQEYADLVALCQFLPGPASSQVNFAIGTLKSGILGGIVSFIGFTLPSAIILVIFALYLQGQDISNAGWLHGLRIVAVSIVAHALLGMASKLTTNNATKLIALLALIGILLFPTPFTQIIIIIVSGIIGYLVFTKKEEAIQSTKTLLIPKKTALTCLGIFILLLLFSFIPSNNTLITIFKHMYTSGSLVFGGGHVVLPLLEQDFVASNLVSADTFLTGFAATQAMPGPLFTFSAYLGASISGILGSIFGLIGIFLPGMLLVLGTLPFWHRLRNNSKFKGSLIGVNAAVVGLLSAALYSPVFVNAIFSTKDFALASLLFGLLSFFKLPPWIVVLVGAIGGQLLSLLN